MAHPSHLRSLCLGLCRKAVVCLLLLGVGCDALPIVADDAGPDATPEDAAVDADPVTTDGAPPDAGPTCEGVGPGGRCAADVLQTCEGGQLIERDCAAEALHCLTSADEPARCGPEPGDCQDLPPGGLCVADRLQLCHADWLREVDCAALGGRCGTAGGRPGCEPGAGGPRTASGVITADRRSYDASGLGPVSAEPVAGATVVVHRAADATPLGFGVTDAAGSYQIAYDPGAGPDGVYVRAIAASFTASHRLWVTDDGDATYAWESAVVDDSAGQVQRDLHVAEADDSGALSIFGVLGKNTDQATAWVQTGLPPLQAYWEQGQRLFCGTCHSHGRIFLLGEPADTDEYDDCVISHEFGHYLAWAASRDDTPGGAHDGTPCDPRLAWSEGLATWIGLHLLGQTVYIDTKATGATVRDPEDMGWDADPFGPLDQDVSEYVVLETLWDMTDPVATGDPMDRTALEVLSVLTGYLPSPGLVDRGVTGVDLVDFLDGWRCQGLGDDPGLTALVVDDQGFPYDFAGPAAPCPKPAPSARLQLLVRPGRKPTVQVRIWDPLGSPAVTARLVLPPGDRSRGAQSLGALAAGGSLTAAWELPRPAPLWLRVGVTLDRGAGNTEHLSRHHWLRSPPARPRTIRYVSAVGLLYLRVRYTH